MGQGELKRHFTHRDRMAGRTVRYLQTGPLKLLSYSTAQWDFFWRVYGLLLLCGGEKGNLTTRCVLFCFFFQGLTSWRNKYRHSWIWKRNVLNNCRSIWSSLRICWTLLSRGSATSTSGWPACLWRSGPKTVLSRQYTATILSFLNLYSVHILRTNCWGMLFKLHIKRHILWFIQTANDICNVRCQSNCNFKMSPPTKPHKKQSKCFP